MKAFSQLGLPEIKKVVKSIMLLQDVLLETDLRIVIQWYGKKTKKSKSALGVQLAAAFAEFGKIHHIVCRECTTSKRSS